jgi:hypothetical protein
MRVPLLFHSACRGDGILDGRGDFDFEEGSWAVRHRRLVTRLAGATDWEEFDGTSRMSRLMGGLANVEDNLLHLPSGSYRALALRTFDPATGLWAIWWVDGRAPHQLDVPVKGRFQDGVGRFVAEDSFQGRPVLVEFQWRQTPEGPRWQQAFSPDRGGAWEVNWTMDFRRV